MKDKILQFKKALKIKSSIIGINFINKIPGKAKNYKDTACTALARALKHEETVFFDTKKSRQLCAGADYFLRLSDITKKEVINTYAKEEHVFKNKKICNEFLKSIPKIPKSLTGKKVVVKPYQLEDKPKVIILVVNPAQLGRILGILNYDNYLKIEIAPNQPTCTSFFAPIATNSPHINFIDYYDRYFQGKVNKKYIWKENELIMSLTLKHFYKILNNLEKTPQGFYKRLKIKPQKVDAI